MLILYCLFIYMNMVEMSSPGNVIFLPSDFPTHGNSLILNCRVERFFPNQIKVGIFRNTKLLYSSTKGPTQYEDGNWTVTLLATETYNKYADYVCGVKYNTSIWSTEYKFKSLYFKPKELALYNGTKFKFSHHSIFYKIWNYFSPPIIYPNPGELRFKYDSNKPNEIECHLSGFTYNDIRVGIFVDGVKTNLTVIEYTKNQMLYSLKFKTIIDNFGWETDYYCGVKYNSSPWISPEYKSTHFFIPVSDVESNFSLLEFTNLNLAVI